MTRNDYEAAAKIVHKYYQHEKNACVSIESYAFVVMEAFIAFFRQDNPNFNAESFRNACKG